MTARNWLITGVSSGFGRELATQLLDRGDTVVGTVRRSDSVTDLTRKYPGTFHRELLDVTDTAAVRDVVDRSFTSLGRIDVVVSNAGYGLFGAAEELSDAQVSHIIASADQEPAPLRIILGSQALQTTVGVLKDRLAGFEAQAGLAASTDFPPGK